MLGSVALARSDDRGRNRSACAHVHNRNDERSWRSASYSDNSPCRNVRAVTAAVQPKR